MWGRERERVGEVCTRWEEVEDGGVDGVLGRTGEWIGFWGAQGTNRVVMGVYGGGLKKERERERERREHMQCDTERGVRGRSAPKLPNRFGSSGCAALPYKHKVEHVQHKNQACSPAS